MKIRAKAKDSAEKVCADLDTYAALVLSVAVPRALNKIGAQAETAGLRKVADIYGIGPRSFDRYVEVQQASSAELEFVLTCKGKGLPMELFDPRQTRQGVTVKIKGRRFLIPHAFIARMASGHMGVFARGGYGGKGKNTPTGETFGRFAFGRNRLAINELFTFSPPDAFGSDEVREAMQQRVDDQAATILEHEIEFAAR